MINRFASHVSRLGLACFMVVAVLAGQTITAQDTSESAAPSSLAIVPESASFYMASMNHRAQYEAVVNSRAYQQLMESPVGVKMRKAYRDGRRRGWEQFGYSPFREFLEDYSQTLGSIPGRMALTYFGEIFENEIFLYADEDWNETSDAITATYGTMFEYFSGRDPSEINEEVWQELLPVLREQLSDVNTPTIVMGTVVDEPALVESMLQLAEGAIDQMLSQAPPEMDYIYDAYQVIEEDDVYLLSFTLTAEMIPWHEITDPDIEPHLPEIRAIMENKSIAISMGTKGNYFVVSVGPSNEHLLSLGNGPLLIDHPKMKAVRSALDEGRELTGVSYMSDEIMSRSGNMDGLIEYLVAGIEMGIAQSGDQPGMDQLIEAVRADADELSADLREIMPRPGAHVAFSYFSEHGIDGYVYNWAENKSLDDSEPLTVLQHVGSKPAMVVAAHEKPVATQQYAMARKWCGKLFDYADMMAPHLTESPEQLDMYDDIMSELKPILNRFDVATADKLIPATEGNQFAFVIDLSNAQSQWHVEMPPAESPVVIPGMAVVIEINDAEMIRQAGVEYLEGARELLEFIRELPDAEIPEEIRIPDPEIETVGDAKMYYYAIPDEAGLDGDIVPHAMLGEQWLYFGYLGSQTRQMSESHRPEFFGPLADLDRPIMGAAFYDNRQMVNAAYDWCKYAMQLARQSGQSLDIESGAESDQLDFSEEDLMETLDRAADLLRCFHGYASISYMEDDVQVTHYQMRFSDVSDN